MNQGLHPAAGRTRRRRAFATLALTAAAAACVAASPASAEVPGPPSFATAVNVDSTSELNSAVSVGDFNHDGRPDIATAIQTEGMGAFLALPGGGYGAVTKYQAPDSFFGDSKAISSMVVADLNGDGNLDLVSQDARGDAIDIVWLGDGHGGFATGAAVALNARPGCGGSSDNPCQAAFPLAPNVADFNEDGKLDIATAAPNTNNVAVVLGHGDGTFGAPAYFPAGTSPITMTSADVNHDGHVDLLTVQSGSNTGLVSLLLGDGHGSFSAPSSFSPGIVIAGQARFADLDEDGNVDLVVANSAAVGKTSIMLGNGDGTFGTPTLLATGRSPSSVNIADLNGDGHLDLVYTMRRDGAIAIWTGDGHAGFAAPVSYGLDGAVSPQAATIADVNGDGLLDVVTANFDDAGKGVSVLVNTTQVTASLGSQLDARIPAYVAIEGGSGSFGDVTPRFVSTQYLADTTLKIATTSPSGVKVSVVAGDPANLDLGGLGPVDVLADVDVTDDDYLSAWFPFATPVPLYLSHGPVNTSLRTLFRLQVPANKVLRRGDVYSEPITYTATSSVP